MRKKRPANPAQIRLKISRTGPDPDVRSGRTGPDMSGLRLIPNIYIFSLQMLFLSYLLFKFSH